MSRTDANDESMWKNRFQIRALRQHPGFELALRRLLFRVLRLVLAR